MHLMVLLLSLAICAAIWLVVIGLGRFSNAFIFTKTISVNIEFDLSTLPLKNDILIALVPNYMLGNLPNDDVIEVQVLGKSKSNCFTYFTSKSQKGDYFTAFLQGSKESFQLSLSAKENEITFEFSYDAASNWLNGIMFFHWRKVKALADSAFDAILQTIEFNSIKKPAVSIEIQKSETDLERHDNQLSKLFQLKTFEIPVLDLARAKWFYQGVFGFEFFDEEKPPYWISHFRYQDSNFLGALVFGEGYLPSSDGPCPFIQVFKFDLALSLIPNYLGLFLFQYVNINKQRAAKFIDTEGNTIGILEV